MLILWLLFWFMMNIKISMILIDSHLSVFQKVSRYVKVSIYLLFFWGYELFDYLVDKDLWKIKWYLKFRT